MGGSSSRLSRALRVVLTLVVVAAVAGAAGWSARALLAPPQALPEAATFTLVEVERGEIERGLNLNVSAQWSGGPKVVNTSSGVLTEARVRSGDRVEPGSVLYTVDLAPVVVASGSVPAFRGMSSGDRGSDVLQLQKFLLSAGFEAADDGEFGPGTVSAVKAWQQSLGVTQTGKVPLGSLVFVPSLPGVFAWEQGVGVGTALSSGTAVGGMLPATPVFSMTLPANQRSIVTEGMPVTIFAPDGKWDARLGAIGGPGEDGSSVAKVVPPQGKKSICGEQCAQLPLSGEGGLRSRVTVIPRREGTVVPTAALAVGANGKSAVIAEDGRSIPVEVEAAAGGQALVTGVSVGERVRVPNQAGGAAPAQTS